MTSKKEKAVNSRIPNDNAEHIAKLRDIKLGDSHNNIPNLPLDIMLTIISMLPLRKLIGCKSLSKAFNNLISDPSFDRIYLNNNSHYIQSIIVDKTKSVFSLDLVEYHRDLHTNSNSPTISKVTCFESKKFQHLTVCNTCLIVGYCKGLFCLWKIEFKPRLHNVFVINPILGEFIELPKHVADRAETNVDHGFGYCQLTNKYKVLRISTILYDGNCCKTRIDILTIGSDKTWRRVSEANASRRLNFQDKMVAVRFALHWMACDIRAKDRSEVYIHASDMTEEKVNKLRFPPEVIAGFLNCQLDPLFDELCLLRFQRDSDDIELWIMYDYGVEGCWTKFALKISTLPRGFHTHFNLFPLTISSEWVIVVSSCNKLVFYDLKKNKCLKVIDHDDNVSNIVHFVPSFVSLKNLVHELMIDVQGP